MPPAVPRCERFPRYAVRLVDIPALGPSFREIVECMRLRHRVTALPECSSS